MTAILAIWYATELLADPMATASMAALWATPLSGAPGAIAMLALGATALLADPVATASLAALEATALSGTPWATAMLASQ